MKQIPCLQEKKPFERALALLKEKLGNSGLNASYMIHKQHKQHKSRFPFEQYIFSRQEMKQSKKLKRSQMIRSIAKSFALATSESPNQDGFRPFSSQLDERYQASNTIRFLKNIDANCLVFVVFEPYGQYFKVTVLNIDGCIFYQSVRQNNLKHSTVLAQIKRKLKTNSFLFIYSKVDDQRTQQNLRKLKIDLGFAFCRQLSAKKENKEQQQFQEENFNYDPNLEVQKRQKKIQKPQKPFKLQRIGNYEIVRFENDKINFNSNQLIQISRDYVQKLLQKNNGIAQYVKSLVFPAQRHQKFDYLRIGAMVLNYNHWSNLQNQKIDNQTQNLLIPKIIKQLQSLAKEQQNRQMSCQKDINNHFAQLLERCKFCQFCRLKNLAQKKKSKYKCQGCSIQLGQDVPLCVLHFQDFHEKKDQFFKMIKNRRKQKGRKGKNSNRHQSFSFDQQKNESNSEQSINQQIKIEQRERIISIDERKQFFDQQYDLHDLNEDIKQIMQVIARLINVKSEKEQSNYQLIRDFVNHTIQKLDKRQQNLTKYNKFPQQ